MKELKRLQAALQSNATDLTLARVSGMSQQAISKYRTGISKVENMRFTNAMRLINYMEVLKMKEKLTVENLYFSHYEDGLHTLEFEVGGKKVFVKNINVDVDGDEDYWDDADNVRKAVDAADEDDIEEVTEWNADDVQKAVTEILERYDEEIRNGLYDIYFEIDYDETIIGIRLEEAGLDYQGDAWESRLIGQVEDGEIMNMDI